MTIKSLIEAVSHRASVRQTTLWFPDVPADQSRCPPSLDGYFSIRLSEMFLRDSRRWMSEICPATLFIVDYQYGRSDVSQPFFVSAKAFPGAEKAGAGEFRINFTDKQILGPTPFAGGEVQLFVGLFQAKMFDYRSELFEVLETVLGGMDLGLTSGYLRMADKLSGNLLKILGAKDVECLLAEQCAIGKQAVPASGYRAYLRMPDQSASANDFVVQDGFLHRKDGAGLVRMADADYCLVRIDTLESRSDYTKMEFHALWREACIKMQTNEAEALAIMQRCNGQILLSPDLTESHKFALMEYYQTNLWAIPSHRLAGSGARATRAGAAVYTREIQRRILRADEPDAATLATVLDGIARLGDELMQAAPARREEDIELDLHNYLLRRGRTVLPSTAADLAKAIAEGTMQIAGPLLERD
jgi:hypothetical protein